MADESATRDSLRRRRAFSLPRPMGVLPSRVWTDEELRRIRSGCRARAMEEKWNVLAEDGGDVFLCRSWTGYAVYRASFGPAEGGWRIVEAVVEGDEERYSSFGDAYDRLMLELVLSFVVLGEPAAALRAQLVDVVAERSGRPDVPPEFVLFSLLGYRSQP
ncbi:hypothetical protein AB0M39_22230 [Streptomyces sp. NPDC051907]|uniref:hypothetical protein n=1 Tax=Streptomyces sp. NPDC051907 TaxID=3155284 RepID=UPI00341F0243